MARAFVGLGANLGDRVGTLLAAIDALASEPGVEVTAVSSWRETEPWGNVEQPSFLNGACELETSLTPRALLDALLHIERALGRERDGSLWGPRTIDLDLLLYDDLVIDEPGLTVPHPFLAERRFVLEPLLELDGELALPDGRRLADIAPGVQ